MPKQSKNIDKKCLLLYDYKSEKNQEYGVVFKVYGCFFTGGMSCHTLYDKIFFCDFLKIIYDGGRSNGERKSYYR